MIQRIYLVYLYNFLTGLHVLSLATISKNTLYLRIHNTINVQRLNCEITFYHSQDLILKEAPIIVNEPYSTTLDTPCCPPHHVRVQGSNLTLDVGAQLVQGGGERG